MDEFVTHLHLQHLSPFGWFVFAAAGLAGIAWFAVRKTAARRRPAPSEGTEDLLDIYVLSTKRDR